MPSVESADDLIDTLNGLAPLVAEAVARGAHGGPGVGLAFGQLARLNRTLHAVALLVPHDHGSEVMILARVLVEAAVRVRWAGTDEHRLRLLLDHATLEGLQKAEALLRHGLVGLEDAGLAKLRADADAVERRRQTRRPKQVGLPTPEQMERQIWGHAFIYDVIFRRTSDEAHASVFAAQRALQGATEESVARALHFALVGASLLFEAAVGTLGWPELIPRLRGVTGWLQIDWT